MSESIKDDVLAAIRARDAAFGDGEHEDAAGVAHDRAALLDMLAGDATPQALILTEIEERLIRAWRRFGSLGPMMAKATRNDDSLLPVGVRLVEASDLELVRKTETLAVIREVGTEGSGT